MAVERRDTAYLVWKLIRSQAGPYAWTALGWILWNAWPLVPGLLAKLFFDALTGRAPLGLGVSAVVALLVLSGLGRALAMHGATRAGVPLRFRLRALMQGNIVRHILRRPAAQAFEGSVGQAISTLRDDAEAGALATDWPYDAFSGLAFGAGGLAILLAVNGRLTLLVFLPLTFLLLLANVARSRLMSVRDLSRRTTADVTGAIAEIFSSVQAIQVAGAEDRILAHLKRLGEARRRATVTDTVTGLAFDGIFQYTMNLGAGMVLLIGAGQMHSGRFTVGDFALFALYLMQVADRMGFLGYLISSYQQSAIAFRRLLNLMRGAPARALVDRPPCPPPVVRTPAPGESLRTLEVRGLGIIRAGTGVVTDVSFTIERGTVTAITGRIGSGKSTLLRGILGLVPTDAGGTFWNGRVIENPGEFLVPPRSAYVPQRAHLFAGTLRQNVVLDRELSEVDLSEVARAAVFGDDLARMPDGWDTPIGNQGVRLSGGQAQRVAIARALARQADLTVLDDVSSALDGDTEDLIWREMLRMRGTFLVVTDSARLLQAARQIIWLEQGRVVALGSFNNLTARGLPSR